MACKTIISDMATAKEGNHLLVLAVPNHFCIITCSSFGHATNIG